MSSTEYTSLRAAFARLPRYRWAIVQKRIRSFPGFIFKDLDEDGNILGYDNVGIIACLFGLPQKQSANRASQADILLRLLNLLDTYAALYDPNWQANLDAHQRKGRASEFKQVMRRYSARQLAIDTLESLQNTPVSDEHGGGWEHCQPEDITAVMQTLLGARENAWLCGGHDFDMSNVNDPYGDCVEELILLMVACDLWSEIHARLDTILSLEKLGPHNVLFQE